MSPGKLKTLHYVLDEQKRIRGLLEDVGEAAYPDQAMCAEIEDATLKMEEVEETVTAVLASFKAALDG